MSNADESRTRAETAIERQRRIQEAIARQPRQMTLQLARELGVAEVDVIRAMPQDRVRELDVSRWEEIFRRLEGLGRVRVLLSNAAATIEAMGAFGGFSVTGDYFNVQTPTLDLHIRWRELAAVFTVQKPGHTDGHVTHSVQFFDHSGNAALKVFLSFGEPLAPQRQKWLDELHQALSRAARSASAEDVSIWPSHPRIR